MNAKHLLAIQSVGLPYLHLTNNWLSAIESVFIYRAALGITQLNVKLERCLTHAVHMCVFITHSYWASPAIAKESAGNPCEQLVKN